VADITHVCHTLSHTLHSITHGVTHGATHCVTHYGIHGCQTLYHTPCHTLFTHTTMPHTVFAQGIRHCATHTVIVSQTVPGTVPQTVSHPVSHTVSHFRRRLFGHPVTSTKTPLASRRRLGAARGSGRAPTAARARAGQVVSPRTACEGARCQECDEERQPCSPFKRLGQTRDCFWRATTPRRPVNGVVENEDAW